MKRALSSVAYQHEQSLSRQASLHAFIQAVLYCCYHQLLGIASYYHRSLLAWLVVPVVTTTATTILLPFSVSYMYYYYY